MKVEVGFCLRMNRIKFQLYNLRDRQNKVCLAKVRIKEASLIQLKILSQNS